MGILEDAASIIASSQYMVVFTGAGMSADSGIPTFRGEDGIWSRFRPEELATPEAFMKDPVKVWKWYLWRISKLSKVKPHRGYKILKRWYDKGIIKSVITQNVDGLFRRAGIDNVLELHGWIEEAKCVRCGYKTSVYNLDRSSLPIICPRCYGLMRPNVVWFGEPLDSTILRRAYSEAEKSDLMLVIGTSGVVYPAAYIPYIAKENGSKIIEVNPEATPISEISDITIKSGAEEALTNLDRILSKKFQI